MDEAALSLAEDFDLVRFKAVVASKCPSSLSERDKEDVAADMLADAVRTSRATGIPVGVAAIQNLTRPRYYERPAAKAKVAPGPLPGGEAGDETTPDIEDPRDLVADLEVRDLVERLPLQQRRAYLLVVEYAMTHAEAAVAMSVTPSTVREHLGKACAALRQAWEAAQQS